jgi:hypothetical protein
MRRSLTLLIAMGLAGAPASSLACELWCSTPVAAHHHNAVGCHQDTPITEGSQQVSEVGDCHDAAASVFLVEGRKTATAGSELLSATLEGLAVVGSFRCPPTAWWSVVQNEPPHVPPFHTILRI